MGIHGLSKVLADNAPMCVRETEFKNYFGRKVAIDASMSIYQFLIQVRQGGENLTNDAGETTSHLMGIFYRTIRMIHAGMKPLYVFDGKPPEMKSGELAKRKQGREKAQAELTEAQQGGNTEDVEKYTKRLVKVTPQHNEDCQKLLKLMGVPFVKAPCEAEAQCSSLVAAGKAYATATEDMDALTFGTTVLLRNLTAAEARKLPVKEYEYSKVLEGLALTRDEFIDLCILLGCDYCDKISGIGPKRAYDLIKEHKNIEKILTVLDPKKYPVPEDWPYKAARRLFQNPEVTPPDEIELKWERPDVEGIVQFMCVENGFSEDRMRSGCMKLTKAREVKAQGRLDTFFNKLPSQSASKKRKPEAKGKGKETAKKKKIGFMSRRR